MIEYLRGCIEERGPDWVVLDLHGFGLRVQVPAGTAGSLPSAGSDVKLWTYLYVREDVRALYGFSTPQERALFVQLLAVSGVGPRVALATLSMLSADRLAAAIESGDEATLARIPGVGKRTASRMVLDLRGKLPRAATTDGAAPAGDDAILEGLVSTGIPRAEAASILASLPLDPARDEAATLMLAFQAWAARGGG
jgi:Holliday junction DNA helicase RuvA